MPYKKKPGNGKIKDLDVDEISLVDSPANRRRFALVKSAKGEGLEELLQSLLGDETAVEVAVQKAESLDADDLAGYVEALSVLKKYEGCFPGELMDVIAFFLGLSPVLQKAQITPVAKSGGLDFVLQNLMLGSGNRRMVESVLKGASGGELEDDDGDLEEDKGPVRGARKSIDGQEDTDLAPEADADVYVWKSL